jgi:AcrR family transcriptional regulator
MKVSVERLSPNQLHKREQLIDAALALLKRDGPRACTTRAIAEESGLGGGLLHYYFESIDEVVDAAAEKMGDEIVTAILAAGEGGKDPVRRFWSIVEAYLQAFERPSGRIVQWMDYWVSAMRSGRAERVAQIDMAVVDALAEALTEAGIPDARNRAHALSAYVLGAVIRRAAGTHPRRNLRTEISAIIGGLAD